MGIIKRKRPEGRNLKRRFDSTITEETRQEAYIARPVKRAREILEIMGDREMTARQILNESPYSDMNAIRPRLTELKNKGRIEAVGKAYDFTTERNVAVFRVKEN